MNNQQKIIYTQMQNKVSRLETSQVKEICTKVFGSENDVVFEICLDELHNRLSEQAFIGFVEQLESMN